MIFLNAFSTQCLVCHMALCYTSSRVKRHWFKQMLLVSVKLYSYLIIPGHLSSRNKKAISKIYCWTALSIDCLYQNNLHILISKIHGDFFGSSMWVTELQEIFLCLSSLYLSMSFICLKYDSFIIKKLLKRNNYLTYFIIIVVLKCTQWSKWQIIPYLLQLLTLNHQYNLNRFLRFVCVVGVSVFHLSYKCFLSHFSIMHLFTAWWIWR